MTQYYQDLLKQALSHPNYTAAQLRALIEESEFYFRILKVKLDSPDPAAREEARRELHQLRTLLEQSAPRP